MTRDGGGVEDRVIVQTVTEELHGAPPINDRWTRFNVGGAENVTERALVDCAREALGLGEQGGLLETIYWQIYDRNRLPWEFTPEVVLAAVRQGMLVRADVTSPGDSDPRSEMVLVVPNGGNGANMLVFMEDGRQTPGIQVVDYLEQNMIAWAIGSDRLRAEMNEGIGGKRAKIIGRREKSAEKLVKERLEKLHNRCESPEELLRGVVETIRGGSLVETSLAARVQERSVVEDVQREPVGRQGLLVDGVGDELRRIEESGADGDKTVVREALAERAAIRGEDVIETEVKGVDLGLARIIAKVYGESEVVKNALACADKETIRQCNETWRGQAKSSFVRAMMVGLDWKTELTTNAIFASVGSVSGVVLSPFLVNAGLLEFSLNPHPAVVGLVGGLLFVEALMLIMTVFRLVNKLNDYNRIRLADEHEVLKKIVDFLVIKSKCSANLADDVGKGLDLADGEDGGSFGSSQLKQYQMAAGR